MSEEPEGWHRTIRGLLEPQGVETLTARNGREALHVLESRQVNVAVLDHDMPQLSGLQVARLIHDRRPPMPATTAPAVPHTILLASHLTDHLLAEALAADVFTVLRRPVDLDLLLDALARILRRYHMSRWPNDG
jgi:CheY-like chemotaxis protein